VCFDVLTQCFIYERLVVPASCGMYQALEVFDNIGIQANSDTNLIWIGFDNCATLSFTEIFTHSSGLDNTVWFDCDPLSEQK